jgi:hypothetical protein
MSTLLEAGTKQRARAAGKRSSSGGACRHYNSTRWGPDGGQSAVRASCGRAAGAPLHSMQLMDMTLTTQAGHPHRRRNLCHQQTHDAASIHECRSQLLDGRASLHLREPAHAQNDGGAEPESVPAPPRKRRHVSCPVANKVAQDVCTLAQETPPSPGSSQHTCLYRGDGDATG